jgi:hypothetical protein
MRGIVGGWGSACRCRQGSGLKDAVRTVGRGVQFKLGLVDKIACTLQGSLLYQMLLRESSDIFGASFLKCLRN